MRWSFLYVLLAVSVLTLPAAAAAAHAPVRLSNPSFGLIDGGMVYSSARQPDGSLVLIGDFSAVNGVPRGGIARLRSNGTVDPEWGPQFYAPLSGEWSNRPRLVADSVGAIYVVGNVWDGSNHFGLIKLSTDTGKVVAGWQSGLGYKGLWDLAVDASGIYAISERRLRKLSFDTGATQWTADPGFVMAMQPDGAGSIYLVASTSFSDPAVLMRLSTSTGAVDAAWAPTLSVSTYGDLTGVLTVDSCGSVYTVGTTFVGGAPRGRIARISVSDGAVDPNWSSVSDGYVHALTTDAQCNMYAGGDFWSIGGKKVRSLAKLSRNDGQAVESWLPDGACCGVDGLAVENSGAIRASGRFRRIGGETRLGLAVLHASDGMPGPAIDAESDAMVSAMAADPDGGIIVAGTFAKAGNQPRHGLLRLRPNGTLDTEWTPWLPNSSQVSVVAVRSGKKVYVGGALGAVNGESKGGLVRLVGNTGALDPNWNSSAGRVDALAFGDDDTVFAGGSFSSIGGVAQPYIAKLSGVTGDADSAWRPNASASVHFLAMGYGGGLFVGGAFQQFGGQPHFRLAKVDAITGEVRHEWQGGCPPGVQQMTLFEDGLLVTAFGGQMAKLSTTTGMGDESFSTIPGVAAVGLPLSPNGSFFATVEGVDYQYSLQKFSIATGAPDPAWNIPLGRVQQQVAVDTRNTVYTVVGQGSTRITAYSTDTIFFDPMDP